MPTAYLAPDGFEPQLAAELARHGLTPTRRHGRLFVTDAEARPLAWAANTWFGTEEVEIASIGAAVRELRGRQRNWALYAPELRGRAGLIAEQLPPVAARPLALGEPAPTAPLGSWTLLARNRLLLSTRCSSPFPHGEPRFIEDPYGPPSRAYLKLWEAFVRLNRWPGPGDRCLDLGASPGGWTWTLARLGATVSAIDRAPLDQSVARLVGVSWTRGSAFSVDPATTEADWICCDVAAYPDRLAGLAERWCAARPAAYVVVTIKLQGSTDLDVVDRLRAVARAEIFHGHHNKHELTFVRPGDREPPDR